MKIFYHLSATQVSEILNVSVNTVYMYTSVLKEKLHLVSFKNKDDIAKLNARGFFDFL